MSEASTQIVKYLESRLRSMPLLKREKFDSKPVVVKSGFESMPESYKFNFEKDARRLSISFLEDSIKLGFFVVGIYKPGDSESLDLMEWRTNRGLDAGINSFVLNSYSGAAEEKVKSFCEFLDKALQDSAILKILRGEAWESTPFDFGDYK